MTTPRVATDRVAFERTAADAPAGARVPVEVRVPVVDPFDAYRRARDGPGGFHLETTGGQSGWGYFGVDPIDRLTVAADETAGAPVGESPSIDALVDRLADESLVRGGCDVPYPCGAVGWLSYDVARELERLPDSADRDRELPRLQLGVYDRIAAWEEPRESDETTLRITACPRVGADGAAADGAAGAVGDTPADAYERGRERALELARAAVEGDPAVGDPPVETDEARFESDCGREAFADRVRRVKEYVRDGDTFQANVSQRLTAPAAVHPVAAFDALRAVNPAPYSALLEFPGVDLVSASPELLLEREVERSEASDGTSDTAASGEGDRLLTEPIAGTRPRGDTPEEDDFLAEDLTSDEKERAEHAMLVDLERNDLGKVSEYGSVEVSEYRRVDRYSEVMHLVSLVEGRLRPEHDLGDAIAAVFPGGTITGAPKPRTMEIIDEVESTRRGPYTGSVGIFGFDGRATLNIVIRTLVRDGEEYHLRVGAGIVHDSVPDREFEETLDKGRALVTAVDAALGDRAAFTVGDHD
ncbi:anthranilate synthase component I family protein [Halosimplex rubrum]|uniref:anthranilate synthase n=1 Tax=Halosimplex rubrum TaxID=869889 RepID=A0A7D5SY12_9EURY|nr:anthranilate synthase component I family protein [Halosimplex rubrum]QLH75948.1 anthranilate synthase component I family protein [Halosimplex rubrum]